MVSAHLQGCFTKHNKMCDNKMCVNIKMLKEKFIRRPLFYTETEGVSGVGSTSKFCDI